MDTYQRKKDLEQEYSNLTRDDLLWLLAMPNSRKATFSGPAKTYFEMYNSKLLNIQQILQIQGCDASENSLSFGTAGTSRSFLFTLKIDKSKIMLKKNIIYTKSFGREELFNGVVYEGLIYKYFFDYMIKNNITPNIPYYFLYQICEDTENTSSELYIEKMAGNTLHSHLLGAGNQNVNFWRSILFQIIYTLKCFQEMNIKHNDLHTGNIFIDPDITGTLRYYVSKNTWYSVKLSGIGLIKLFDMDMASVDCLEVRVPGIEQIYDDFKKELQKLTKEKIVGPSCDNSRVEWGYEDHGIEARGKSLFDLFVTICTIRKGIYERIPGYESILDPESLSFLQRIFDFTKIDFSNLEDDLHCRYPDVQNNPEAYPTYDQILADPYFDPIKNISDNPDGVFHLPSIKI